METWSRGMEKLNYDSDIIQVAMIPNYFQAKVQIHAM
jgi:hypothetical protein